MLKDTIDKQDAIIKKKRDHFRPERQQLEIEHLDKKLLPLDAKFQVGDNVVSLESFLQALPETLTSHFQKATAEADAAKRAAEAAVAVVAAAEVRAASEHVQLKEVLQRRWQRLMKRLGVSNAATRASSIALTQISITLPSASPSRITVAGPSLFRESQKRLSGSRGMCCGRQSRGCSGASFS